jgi:HD-GYP domain-containing protein (c-di-GMP phosphodiesterase class II)
VLGAYLSDPGKIKLDKSILYKPDRLNDDEQMEMETSFRRRDITLSSPLRG